MGYDRSQFVDEIQQEMICGLCNKVFEYPREWVYWHGVFWLSCIENYIARHQKCPGSGHHLTKDDLMLPNYAIREKYNALRIIWPEGWGQKILMGELLSHEIHWQLGQVTCELCGTAVQRRTLQVHTEFCKLNNALDHLESRGTNEEPYYNHTDAQVENVQHLIKAQARELEATRSYINQIKETVQSRLEDSIKDANERHQNFTINIEAKIKLFEQKAEQMKQLMNSKIGDMAAVQEPAVDLPDVPVIIQEKEGIQDLITSAQTQLQQLEKMQKTVQNHENAVPNAIDRMEKLSARGELDIMKLEEIGESVDKVNLDCARIEETITQVITTKKAGCFG